MSTIIIYTQAYNAEKTLRKTIDSILNQTHTDFIYYLLDNASTDGTRDIIREYAKRDKRIVHLYNRINSIGNSFWQLIRRIRGDYYVSYLDADDEYYPNFFEKVL